MNDTDNSEQNKPLKLIIAFVSLSRQMNAPPNKFLASQGIQNKLWGRVFFDIETAQKDQKTNVPEHERAGVISVNIETDQVNELISSYLGKKG